MVQLQNELRTTRDHQSATAEILRAIAMTSGDAERALQQIAKTTARLFGVPSVRIGLVENGEWSRTISVGVTSERIATAVPAARRRLGERTLPSAVVLENRQIHIPDVDNPDPSMADWPGLRPAREAGTRVMAGTPLRREDKAIGALIVYRDRLAPFTAEELTLLQTFADQAVIAIENVRLFNETQEALERQTATADILKVIASSPTDVQPVFKAIAASANRLIGGFSATVMLFVGNALQLVAFTPTTPAADEVLQASFPRPIAEFPPFELVRDGKTVQFPDTESKNVPPVNRELARLRGYRGMVFTPLMSKGMPIGILSVTRKEPGTFAAHHVQLLQTFADQAVIAIENVRLFNETQEALERQTAVSDILRVISSSPDDVQPVFNTVAERAARICGAQFVDIIVVQDDAMHQAASFGNLMGLDTGERVPVDRTTIMGRSIFDRKPFHINDALAVGDDFPGARQLAIRFGHRTVLAVPLLREGRALGTILVRRTEVRPFEDKHIALLNTFADQAAIAIENVRLLNETREALERQTATADILKVIASSPSDTQPVFAAIATSANRLIGGFSTAVFRFVDNVTHLAAFTPTNAAADEFLKSSFPLPLADFVPFLLVRDGETVQFADTESEEVPQLTRDLARLRGYRSMLFTPLMSGGTAIGLISVTRKEPGSFAARHVELVRTFADQAVIAIQNARLFNEVQARTRDLTESLEQQTATANVLKVISRSAFDLDAVLNSLTKSAVELCNSTYGAISLYRDGVLVFMAQTGCTPEFAELLWSHPAQLDRKSVTGRTGLLRTVVQVPDVVQDEDYDYHGGEIVGNYRSATGVPLLRNGELEGVFTLMRREPGNFTPRQVELVQTFADQAVIAIENVRLFNKTQEALERQTATADILKVIASSPSDVQPVFAAIAERSNRLIDGLSTAVYSIADETMHLMAFTRTSAEADAALQASFPRPLSEAPWGDQIRRGEIVEIPDAETEWAEDPNLRKVVQLRGFRSLLLLPLLRDGATIGIISVTRKEPGTFAAHHVQLLQTFADQAVIAIGNVRLFDEVQARTKELAASLDDLRTAQDRLVQTEKLASLGQLTAGIAHEIKNPLNFVNNFSALSAELTDELNDVLKPAPLSDKMREEVDGLTGLLKDNLEKVVQHGKRADSIVKNMLLHSREGSGEQRPTDINALLDESLNLAYHGARAEKPGFNITLQRDFDEGAGSIEAFPQEITRAFLNLISNGFYAATKRQAESNGANFEPLLCATTRDLGSRVEVRIRDNGTGIPPEVKEKMFNPFFTTKPAGEGTGLGLSMSHDIIVKQHGGRIDVETEPGCFTEFTIVLPRTIRR